ncbi:MAG TPA: HEAT repeat domain-containing protein [Polyangiaceae bacterium]|nr:HEAT repeat domain-containing protein [Polyangiaceae bacterium]
MRPWIRSVLVAGALTATALPARALLWPNAIQRIEQDLTTGDVAQRRGAAERIRELPAAVARRAVLHALTDDDVPVRLSAAQAGRALRLVDLPKRVMAWLTEPDLRLRLAAAELLAAAPNPGAIGPLTRALSDAEPLVRATAATALGVSGSSQAVVGLLGQLDDSAPEVRERVVRALARLRDVRAVVPLVAKVDDPQPAVRRAAARALGELGDARAVSALILALRDSDAEVRSAALDALGELAEPSALPSVVALLAAEANEAVRSSAFDALARLGSSEAIAALIAAFATHAEQRDLLVAALARIGAPAAPALVSCVRAADRSLRSDGCALALSRIRAPAATATLMDAARKASISPEAALDALAFLADPAALPLALEHLGSSDPSVRRAALKAADALLDPRRADGRAVEPLVLAFQGAGERRSERLELVRLLGNTASPRAAKTLIPIARSADDLDFRVAALSALGSIEEDASTSVLLAALGDVEPAIRSSAALAIRRRAPKSLAAPLVDRLEQVDSASRPWLALALAGPIAGAQNPALVARLLPLLERSSEGERDALIEAVAHAPGPAAERVLVGLSRSRSAADRAKVAEGLAARTDARELVLELLGDADASVRANALWSSGSRLVAADLPLITRAFSDRDLGVAANAVAALGRISAREGLDSSPQLCELIADPRAPVRAAALAALRNLRKRCAAARDRQALTSDTSGRVRRAAARLVRDVPQHAEDLRALRRCHADEPLGAVAIACATASESTAARTENVLVFVATAGEAAPVARAAFALERPDGLTRYGITDRRGAVCEIKVAAGQLALSAPAATEE